MLDGPRWARRTTVADRELTPSLLDSMMGWASCERIWLPEWIKDRDSVVNRIYAAVEQAKAAEVKRAEEQAALLEEKQPVDEADLPDARPVETPAAKAESLPHNESPDPLGDPIEVDVVIPIAHVATSNTAIAPTAGRGTQVSYVAAPTNPVGSRDELDRPQWESVRTRIQDAVRESIEIEGPIALNRLIRNVVHRFGFDRAAAKRQEVVRQFVPVDLIHEDELGCFVWPSDLDRHAWTGFRTTPSGFVRPLDEIAGEEIINALVHAARNGVYDREQLMRDTLAYFDQSRLTKQSADRLELCITKAERLGKLVRRGVGYVSAT